jgi:hypothetical protein
MNDQRTDRESGRSMNNKGLEVLTEHFSRFQLVILFVMVVAFTHPLRDRILGMLGVEAIGIVPILGSAVAAGVIAWATAFVMLRLMPKRPVNPLGKN